MKKKCFLMLLTLVLSLLATTAFAYDAEIDGIYYYFSGTKAEVTHDGSGENSYSGDIVIPPSVTYNGSSYTVTSIGNSAFWACSGLTSVTIPNSVTSIGEIAFNHCRGLTSVTIPNSVTSIGQQAFADCRGLTSVTIGNSVTSIDSGAFYGCSGLTRAEFASIESLCAISFVGDDSNPLYYARHLYIGGEEVTDLVIPNSVTSIGRYAFYHCYNLTSVTIGNSVTSIGSFAFYDCSGLTRAEFASIESLCAISFFGEDSNPLYYAQHLYIGGEEVTDLVIPNSVTSIGDYAFYNCRSLTSVTIPESVTKLYGGTFEGCSNLKSAVVRAEIMEGFAFYNSGLESLTIGKEVREIAAGNGCLQDFFSNDHPFTNLKYLTFEDGDDAIVIDGVKAYFIDTNTYSYFNPFEDSPIKAIYIGRNISFAGGHLPSYYIFWGYDLVHG